MSHPITWLPPLNSNHDSTIHVSAHQYHLRTTTTSTNPSTAEFLIKLNVSVDFYSSDPTVQRSIQGLSTWHSHRLPCHSSSSSTITISRLISHMPIPFPLHNPICWTTQSLDGFESQSCVLENEDDVVESFADFLCRTRAARYNQGRSVVALKLTVEKKVILPACEFEAWTRWYDQQKRLSASFEIDYAEAISRPRKEEEVFGVEEVGLEGYELTEKCSICLEELGVVGSLQRVTRLPCSHMYHRECVLKWLKRSNVCPLCRFVLPV